MPSSFSLGSRCEAARAEDTQVSLAKKVQQSLAFKSWARGRCYRCLASDHQVSSCRDHFRCIRCRRPGHRERQCRFWSPSAAPSFCSPTAQPRHSQHSRSWAEVVAMPPSDGHGVLLPKDNTTGHPKSSPALRPVGSFVKDNNHCCNSACGASTASTPLNLPSQLVPLLESLRSDIKHWIEVRLEEVMRPLREEASIIKLWLARIANHLECGQPRVEHSSIRDVTELFGPCSPVRHSPTSSMLASLAAACVPPDCLPHQDTSIENVDPVLNELTTEVATMAFGTEFHQDIPMDQEQAIEVTTETSSVQMTEQEVTAETSSVQTTEQALMQTVTSIEDVVLVEDASDDELLDTQETVKDPIFLVTIEDCATYSAAEVNTEEPKVTDEAPPIEATSPPAATALKDEDLACHSVHPLSPLRTRRRRQHKSYDGSSLRRSARLAQRGVLKDLGIVGNDGKLNEDAVQIYADCLKKVLPSDLLKPLMELKGRAFWDMVAEVSLSFF